VLDQYLNNIANIIKIIDVYGLYFRRNVEDFKDWCCLYTLETENSDRGSNLNGMKIHIENNYVTHLNYKMGTRFH